jgi:RNA polymerase sigma-70 factor (ECF subfamily)
MTPTAPPTPASQPDDPVRAAVNAPGVREELRHHALARLGVWLADRPPTARAAEAEDAVQDAVERGLARRSTFDPARGTARGWLHGILDRVVSERCRALRKLPAQPPADPAAWDVVAACLEDDPDTLAELLDRLPADQRLIVTLHHLDGLTHRQIGERLGISEQNSRVRLARAMLGLKRLAAGVEDGR